MAKPRAAQLALLTLVAVGSACSVEEFPRPDDPGSEAPVADCFVNSSSAPVVALPGRLAVGSFEVSVDADGALDVYHGSEPSRSLFAGARSGGLLRLTRAALHAEEHQGSFAITEGVAGTCAEARLDEARQGAGALILRGGFDDAAKACGPVTWEVQLCEAAPGHLAFRVTSNDASFTRITLRVASDASERIYGLGEQFPHDRLDLKGRAITVLSQEGGVGRGHTPITQAMNLASPGAGGSEETTYYAAPHYLTSRLRSLFLENTEVAVFDFRQDEVTEIRLHATAMTGRVLWGRSPLELIERFTDYAGRMPPLPEWANQGAILALARDLQQSRQILADLRSHGAEIAAVWNQTWSGKVRTFIGEQVLWNWVQSPQQHPDWSSFVADLAGQGVRVLCYVNPMLVDPPAEAGSVARNLFSEARAGNYFVRDRYGDALMMPVTAFKVGLLDLSNTLARNWMKQVIKDEVLGRAACSGWMADFAEALPFDATLESGANAAAYHNRYPVEWMRLNREAVEEAGRLGDVLVFNRSGSARTPAYSMLLWQGDQLTTWDKYDGLVSALHGLLNGGFSGIALNHSDTGGYTSLSLDSVLGYDREAEQLKRWTEMNAFTAALRTHEGNQPGLNAQVYSDPEAMAHFARFTKVYRALAFYRRTLFEEARSRGWPVVRHLWLHYPEDDEAQQVDDQFLLGSEILVAPIKNKCWTPPSCPYNKSVYLPVGEWVHLWSGTLHGEAGRSTRVTVSAPIGKPAVFYRRGSVVGATFVQNLKAAGIEVADPP
jgi:alpha-glucosidase